MNVYSIDPNYAREDNFSYLLNILKVRKVISLTNEIPLVCEPLLICRYTDDDDKFIQRAVHKFNEPICAPRLTSGKWTGDFLVYDKYKESRAYNPIYNLEYCNDENVLVLANSWDFEKFVKYALNLLKKYANKLHYETKICFVCFPEMNGNYDVSLFLHSTSIYYNGKFKSLRRYQPFRSDIRPDLKQGCSYSIHNIQNIHDLNKYGLFYDPILSYINKKLKELLPKDKHIDLVDFFAGRYVLNSRLDNILDDREVCHSSDDSLLKSTIEAELEYIRNNGGDWIDY